MPKKIPEIVAAVDLGSNSFHMIVCSLNGDKLKIIDRLKEMVRLASGLDKRNVLDHAAQERALACLERFGQRLRNVPPENVRVVGTNTLRTAKNAEQFLVKAEKALNHKIDIISGIEEARLIYQGVAYSLSSHALLRLVMDIGGGSTEYIIGSGANPLCKESLHMGCVSVSKLFFKDGHISKEAFNQALLFAEQKLEPFETKFNSRNWEQAIGASGSLRAIAKVLDSKGWSNNGITLDGLQTLVDYLIQKKHIDALEFEDFDRERLPVFPGGVAIAYATFKTLKINQMTVSDGALRDGLIQDLLGRLYNHDIRSETARSLAERYHTDAAHANRIKQTANAMLVQLSANHAWAEQEICVQLLNWAAELHEIGHDIAHSQYHKHSAYVVKHGDLAGFSKQDQLLLSTIIRSHRRKFSLSRFNRLPEDWCALAPLLTIILRLAVLLRRNRHDEDLPEFSMALEKIKHGYSVQLRFPSQWLADSPLTQADLTKEADYLKAAGVLLEFS